QRLVRLVQADPDDGVRTVAPLTGPLDADIADALSVLVDGGGHDPGTNRGRRSLQPLARSGLECPLGRSTCAVGRFQGRSLPCNRAHTISRIRGVLLEVRKHGDGPAGGYSATLARVFSSAENRGSKARLIGSAAAPRATDQGSVMPSCRRGRPRLG